MNKSAIIRVLTNKMTGLVFNGAQPVGGSILDPDTQNELMKAIGKREYITTYVVRSVVADVFFDKLKHRIKADSVTQGKLRPTQIQAISNQVAETLATIPFSYHVLLPLPRSSSALDHCRITDEIDLLEMTQPVHELYEKPHNTRNGVLGLVGTLTALTRVKQGQNVLRIRVSGYISRLRILETKGVDPFFYLKAIVAYLHIHGVLVEQEIQYGSFSNSGYSPTKYRYYVYTGNFEFVRQMQETFDDDLTRERFKIENSGDEKYHLLNVVEYLQTFLKERSKVDATLQKARIDLLKALYWYYESIKSPETHQQAINLCTSIDALFEKTNDPDASGYKAAIKCEMIAQSVSARLDNEKFIKKRLVELFQFRNEVIHGKTSILSTQKYGAEGVPQEILVGFTRRHIGVFLSDRVRRYNLAVYKR